MNAEFQKERKRGREGGWERGWEEGRRGEGKTERKNIGCLGGSVS